MGPGSSLILLLFGWVTQGERGECIQRKHVALVFESNGNASEEKKKSS